MSVVYRGFELREGQKLLLEFTTHPGVASTGRVVYTLADLGAVGVHPDDDYSNETFDIDTHMGFDIDSHENIRPDRVSELDKTENPITTAGLPTVAWEDLEVGMTVVVQFDEAIAEITLGDEDVDAAREDEMFYPFSMTVSEDTDTLYLKDTPGMTAISSPTSDGVNCQDDDQTKGAP